MRPMNATPGTQNAASLTPDWERFCASQVTQRELGIRLDLSRTPVDPTYVRSMQRAGKRALRAMEQLEQGEIANPDEGRQVGHYWLRDPQRAPRPEIAAAIQGAAERVEEFARRVTRGEEQIGGQPFRHFLVVGIGGSALGPQLVIDALAPVAPPLSAHFLDNTDPDGIERTLAHLGEELDQTLVIVISKSGGTKETRNGMLAVEAALQRRGRPFGPQAVAITMPSSQLEEEARAKAFRAVFPIWDWVGGRTSVTSAVGLLPAALSGIDTSAFLAGARAMDAWSRARVVGENPALLLALTWYALGDGRGARDMVILPYCDRLLLFGRYLQQLVMESLGKERDLDGRTVHQGLTVYGNKGSTDQHAYIQQLREGPDDFFVTFIQVAGRDEDEPSATAGRADAPASSHVLEVEPHVTAGDYLLGFLLGTRAALAEKGRASVLIRLERLDARTLGALIALYERAVGFYATLIHVNAYHQPGVEAGKRAAGEVLEVQRALLELWENEPDARLSVAEACARLDDAAADPETVYQILAHLAAHGRLAQESGRGPNEARFSASGA